MSILKYLVHRAAPTSAATFSIEFSAGPQFEIEESCIAALFGWVQKAHAQDLRVKIRGFGLVLIFSLFSIGRTFSYPSTHNVRYPPPPLRD